MSKLLNASARVDADKIEANPALKPIANVWNQLVIDNALLKHCNERAISTRIVVQQCSAKNVLRTR